MAEFRRLVFHMVQSSPNSPRPSSGAVARPSNEDDECPIAAHTPLFFAGGRVVVDDLPHCLAILEGLEDSEIVSGLTGVVDSGTAELSPAIYSDGRRVHLPPSQSPSPIAAV